MKKIILIVMTLSLVLALCACGSQPAETPAPQQGQQPAQTEEPSQPADNGPQTPEAPAPGQSAEANLSFSYKGTAITMHAPAADILAALGEPKSVTEEPSCAFEGMDKTYYYGSFYVQTYPQGDEDFIFCLWFADDTINTDEGIYIGASDDEVKKAYGEDSYDGSNAYIINQADSKLTIIMDSGEVAQIIYDAIVF